MLRCRFVFLLALAWTVSLPAIAQDHPRKALIVGVVNLEKVILEHPLVKEAVESAKRDRTQKTERLRNKEALRRSLVQNLDLLRPGSKEYLETRKKIAIQDKTVDLDLEMIQVEYQFAILKVLRQALKDAKEETAKVARQEGFDLILNRTDRPVGGRTQWDFLDRLAMRELVFVGPRLDITAKVMERIKARGGVPRPKDSGKPGGKKSSETGGK